MDHPWGPPTLNTQPHLSDAMRARGAAAAGSAAAGSAAGFAAGLTAAGWVVCVCDGEGGGGTQVAPRAAGRKDPRTC
eukprot:gene17466-biopygen2329